jgi:hypothetical protein
MISYENLEKAYALKKEIQEVDAALEYFRHGISVSAQFPFNPHYVLNVLQTKRIIIKDEFMDKFGVDIDYNENEPLPKVAQQQTTPFPPEHIDKEI